MPKVNTPYDDVFRTLLNDCSSLIIPVINEIFAENYTGKEEIIFAPNEHFLNQQNGRQRKQITDSSFKILGEPIKKYHLECQSSVDYSMLIRFWEYDAQIALNEGSLEGNHLTIILPHSAVLFLRSNTATPDKLQIELQTPGGDVSYDIPVMKLQSYTIDDIFEKGLLFLIPFYIFTHEKYLKDYNRDSKKLDNLILEYQHIIEQLEALTTHEAIDEYTRCTLIDMSKKVLRHIAQKHKKVKKGMKTVMGGKILEHKAKTIQNKGIRKGLKKGRLETLYDLVQNNDLSIQTAASYAELSEKKFVRKMEKYQQHKKEKELKIS